MLCNFGFVSLFFLCFSFIFFFVSFIFFASFIFSAAFIFYFVYFFASFLLFLLFFCFFFFFLFHFFVPFLFLPLFSFLDTFFLFFFLFSAREFINNLNYLMIDQSAVPARVSLGMEISIIHKCTIFFLFFFKWKQKIAAIFLFS